MSDVTRILSEIESGDPTAAEKLLPLVYDELRKLAAQKMAHEKAGQTLQATALVHEAYLRLVGADDGRRWQGRAHFFLAAAEAMRRILIENARRRGRVKRGGKLQRLQFEDFAAHDALPLDDLVALDEALARLATEEPRAAEIVRLRFFAGLNHDEVAMALGVSTVTAKRSWRYARAWLHREMQGPEDPASNR